MAPSPSLSTGDRVEMKLGHPFKGTVTEIEHTESGGHYWVRWDDGHPETGPFGDDDIQSVSLRVYPPGPNGELYAV